MKSISPVQPNKQKTLWVLTPLFGVFFFIALYIVATFLYPGGSQVDKNAIGFSWLNNYWCNLLNENAINGQHNPARPVALTAMFILCLSLGFFFYLFPKLINFSKYGKISIQLSGIIGMIIGMFLFTKWHDLVLNLASLFGIIALTGIYIGLYKSNWRLLFWFGILNLLLVVLNNYVYYTNGLIIYLPVIQKFSFVSFLSWFCCIDINLYRKTSTKIRLTHLK